MSELQKLMDIEIVLGKTSREMYARLVLPKNLKKGSWFDMTNEEIIKRIDEELDELKVALYFPKDKKRIKEEAADVCNFLGFLIDNQGE
jgi:phosphoribosyl-ATP pyrophosphohydrolase